jgi:hypothetical protein
MIALSNLLIKKTNRDLLRSIIEEYLRQHFGIKDASLTGVL